MAVQAKEIKERLKSIKNTTKITKTMELVSAAKMRRAISTATESRYYASLAWDLMQRVKESAGDEVTDELARFFEEPKADGVTTIVMLTSNRGLCGAFNANIIKQVFAQIEELGKDNVRIVAIGKKGVATLNAYGIKAEMALEKDDAAKTADSITNIANYAFEEFSKGATDRVLVAYTDFRSPISQVATLKQLFPLSEVNEVDETIGREGAGSVELPEQQLDYAYEPGEAALLQYVLPRIAVSEMYQALLESNASEHSARMMAMKNASEAAADMAKELNLEYNRARQASITQEIAEIAAGAEAVSGA